MVNRVFSAAGRRRSGVNVGVVAPSVCLGKRWSVPGARGRRRARGAKLCVVAQGRGGWLGRGCGVLTAQCGLCERREGGESRPGGGALWEVAEAEERRGKRRVRPGAAALIVRPPPPPPFKMASAGFFFLLRLPPLGTPPPISGCSRPPRDAPANHRPAGARAGQSAPISQRAWGEALGGRPAGAGSRGGD